MIETAANKSKSRRKGHAEARAHHGLRWQSAATTPLSHARKPRRRSTLPEKSKIADPVPLYVSGNAAVNTHALQTLRDF